MRIYVGNLNLDCSEQELDVLFGRYGDISRIAIILDDPAGPRSAHGFVEMANGGDAAISAMNGHRLDGMVLNVHRARDYSDLASLRAAIVRARNERIQ